MNNISSIAKIIAFSFIALILCCGYAFADDPCPTLHDYIEYGVGENFILKEAYQIIADACTSVANFSWNAFAKPLQAVVGLGTAIYIAVYTLRNIGTFSQQDTSAYLSNEKNGVIPIAVKMAAIVWLLGNQTFLYKYLIGLAITTGMEIGTLISTDAIQTGFNSTGDLKSLFWLSTKLLHLMMQFTVLWRPDNCCSAWRFLRIPFWTTIGLQLLWGEHFMYMAGCLSSVFLFICWMFCSVWESGVSFCRSD